MRLILQGVYFFIVLQLFIAGAANAQLWLEDREYREGPGFKIGSSLVLHTGLGAELGYDSNATYTHEPLHAGRMRFTPYVDIATRSPQRSEANEDEVSALPNALFRFGIAVSYDRYLGSDSDVLDKFNSKTNPFGIDAHLDFTLLPDRKVSCIGGITYLKTLEPYETAADAQSKHNLAPMLGLRLMPGGGTLSIEPKYRLDLLVFDEQSVGINSNRFAHEFSVNTNWKILPKTALISNVLFRPTVYYGELAKNIDSYPLRSWLGAQGLLLDKFGFRALLGYGAGFYESGPNFEGIIGDGAVMFYFKNSTKATIGMKRDFVDSFYGNYYVMNGGYSTLEHMFNGRVLLLLEASIYKRLYAYDDGFDDDAGYTRIANTQHRKDLWISASALAEWRVKDWLALHLSMKIWKDVTDFAYTTTRNDPSDPAEAGPTYVEVSFSKLEAFVGVRAHY